MHKVMSDWQQVVGSEDDLLHSRGTVLHDLVVRGPVHDFVMKGADDIHPIVDAYKYHPRTRSLTCMKSHPYTHLLIIESAHPLFAVIRACSCLF